MIYAREKKCFSAGSNKLRKQFEEDFNRKFSQNFDTVKKKAGKTKGRGGAGAGGLIILISLGYNHVSGANDVHMAQIKTAAKQIRHLIAIGETTVEKFDFPAQELAEGYASLFQLDQIAEVYIIFYGKEHAVDAARNGPRNRHRR